MNYGEAIEGIKSGQKAAREGWLKSGQHIDLYQPALPGFVEIIRIFTRSGSYGAYTASHCDTLAEDWGFV